MGKNFFKIMSAVTAVLFAGMAIYAYAWYAGKVHGDIAAALLVLLVVTFIYWLLDMVCLKPQRLAQARSVEQQVRALQGAADETETVAKVQKAADSVLLPPWWIEWTAGFFWVILIVFFLRSFVVEPFKIPSSSMRPTLETGDFILVNKFGYGLRLPVANTRLTNGADPQRGDVVVFRLPTDERITYIKRIIGLPGDEVVYRDKRLTVNGQEMPQTYEQEAFYEDDVVENGKVVTRRYAVKQYQEQFGASTHNIFMDPRAPGSIGYGRPPFPLGQNCYYDAAGFSCKVPEGYYFTMGDNRDYSSDSRYWGFVPEANIVGKAFFVWMNFGKLSRIGGFE